MKISKIKSIFSLKLSKKLARSPIYPKASDPKRIKWSLFYPTAFLVWRKTLATKTIVFPNRKRVLSSMTATRKTAILSNCLFLKTNLSRGRRGGPRMFGRSRGRLETVEAGPIWFRRDWWTRNRQASRISTKRVEIFFLILSYFSIFKVCFKSFILYFQI